MAIVKTNDIYEDVNLVDPSQSKIYVTQLNDASTIYYPDLTVNNMFQVNYEKYQIKETDMRIKTATFKSNTYIDLTTGKYLVWIISPHHENFYGTIINIEYDTEDGKYEYSCQDYNRNFLWKTELINANITVHHLMQYLLTRGGISTLKNATKAQLKTYKTDLSGLRPAYQYESNLYDMIIKNWNVMTQHLGVIIRNKSAIEIIRDVIFGSGANIDLYFTSNGVLHLAPYNYKEWLNTGVHLTRSHVKEASFKVDVTNIVTGGIVNGSDLTAGKSYTSKQLLDIDLSQIFGELGVSVNDPDAKKATSSSSSSSKTKTVKKAVMDKKTANIYNTKKKVVYLNSDDITNKSADRKRMKDMAKILKKNGWTVHIISEIGSEAHYRNRSKVKGGIWCTIYGGACAGTLKESASNSWFLNPLKKNHSRVVVCIFNKNNGILKGGKYYKFLPRAYDDGFSGSGFSGLKNPLKYMSNHGVPVMYATSASKMAKKFLAGGDNYKDWKKHDVNWLGTKK